MPSCQSLPAHHLGDRDEFVALVPVAPDQAIGRFDSVAAVDAQGAMAAVVQQNDVTAADLALGVGDDGVADLALQS